MSCLVVVATGNIAWAGLADSLNRLLARVLKLQPPLGFVSFSFYISVPFPFLCPRVNITFWGTGLSSHPIPRVVGGC